MKTMKPQVRTLSTGVAPRSTTKRLRGNPLYAVMKRLARERPRMCAECHRHGLVRYGDVLDHVIPLGLGGSNDPVNLQWLCGVCHADKTAREAAERGGGGSKV